ncbi:MAG: M17 family peptidase N-terminal domain-containing protein, partial [Candidatus Thorarchaeota archaeon]
MKITLNKSKIEDIDEPIVLVGVVENPKEDSILSKKSSAINGLVNEIVEMGDFKGESKEQLFIYSNGKIKSKRILLVGLGKEEKLTLEELRKIFGEVSRRVRDLDVKKMAVSLDYFVRNNLKAQDVVEAITQGILMGSFQNLKYRTKNLDKFKKLDELIIFSDSLEPKTFEVGAKNGEIIAEAVNFCRELAWGPANYITPTVLAEE